MKHFSILGAIAAVLWIMASPAHAAAPNLIPVQGVLTDAAGAPVNGSVDITLVFYDAPANGAVLHTEMVSATVDRGAFTIYVGATTALDLSVFRDIGTAHLGIKVGSDPEMTPRIQIATAPYAAFAQWAGDATTVGGKTPTDFAPATHGHDWTELTGVPSGFSDGVDNDSLGGLSCGEGQVAYRSGGNWTCGSTADWDTAFGWGDHATAGYVVAPVAFGGAYIVAGTSGACGAAGSCLKANPATGGCSCPSGFASSAWTNVVGCGSSGNSTAADLRWCFK